MPSGSVEGPCSRGARRARVLRSAPSKSQHRARTYTLHSVLKVERLHWYLTTTHILIRKGPQTLLKRDAAWQLHVSRASDLVCTLHAVPMGSFQQDLHGFSENKRLGMDVDGATAKMV